MTSTLTVLSNDGTPVDAQILVGIDGRTIYDAFGTPLVAPLSYLPEQAANSAIQDANTWGYTTGQVLWEFYRSNPRDVQRSYNGQVALDGNGFVKAFIPAGSYSLGYTGAALGVYLDDLLVGGGMVNLGGFLSGNFGIHLDGDYFNNPVNAANIKKGYSDYLMLHPLQMGPRCFPASTPIATSLTSTTAISALRVGDTVLAFDPYTDHGRGALVARRVTKLYRNTTTEWVKLNWIEDGESRELVMTPGHHVLDAYGAFPTVEAMLKDGRATVVQASGQLAEIAAERIVYSAATAHLFEQATTLQARHAATMRGSTALAPQHLDAWTTYNFEVEDLHTYIAGGIRVHNESGFLGRVGNAADDGLDKLFGFDRGGAGDNLTDVLTSPFHIAGNLVEGVRDAANDNWRQHKSQTANERC